MTPDMVKRVEFLRDAAARGYSSRWAAGELGVSQNRILEICRRHSIKLKDWGGVNRAQGVHRARGTTGAWKGYDASIDDCEDLLPDVGEV